MTTETDTEQGSKKAADEEEQSFLPTVLAGAGILAVAALLIFWPSDDDAKKGAADGSGKGKTSASARRGGAEGAAGRAAGVGARSVDAATTPPKHRMNPAIKLPANNGMAPAMPEAAPKDPPPEATDPEKIAFYEKRLELAVRLRDNRKKFADRLPKTKERIEASPNPAASLATYEQRKKIVEDNYAKAQADVEDIEAKLSELRGG